MPVRDAVRMWKTKVPIEFEKLIDEGKQVELLVMNGLLILQRDDEGMLHITWLHEDEVGTSLIGMNRQKT